MKIKLCELRKIIKHVINESNFNVNTYFDKLFYANGVYPPVMKKVSQNRYEGEIDKNWIFGAQGDATKFHLDVNGVSFDSVRDICDEYKRNKNNPPKKQNASNVEDVILNVFNALKQRGMNPEYFENYAPDEVPVCVITISGDDPIEDSSDERIQSAIAAFKSVGLSPGEEHNSHGEMQIDFVSDDFYASLNWGTEEDYELAISFYLND